MVMPAAEGFPGGPCVNCANAPFVATHNKSTETRHPAAKDPTALPSLSDSYFKCKHCGMIGQLPGVFSGMAILATNSERNRGGAGRLRKRM